MFQSLKFGLVQDVCGYMRALVLVEDVDNEVSKKKILRKLKKKKLLKHKLKCSDAKKKKILKS